MNNIENNELIYEFENIRIYSSDEELTTVNEDVQQIKVADNSDNTLNNRMGKLLNNPLYSDITFTFIKNNNDQQSNGEISSSSISDSPLPLIEYYAHKVILSVGGAGFNAMVSDCIQESGKVLVTDIPAEEFLEILRYLYTDRVHFTVTNVYKIVYGAHKYNLQELNFMCNEYLCKILNDDNICEIYDHLYLMNFKITEKCIEIIQDRTTKILASPKFSNISIGALRSILTMDNLKISEHSLFEMVLKWTARACERSGYNKTSYNQRKLLGDCTYLIRFPTMTAHEFSHFVQTLPEFFTSQEIADIFQYILMRDNRSLSFSVEKRNPQIFLTKYILRVNNGVASNEYLFQGPMIDFQVNKSIELLSFGLYGSPLNNKKETIHVQMYNSSMAKCLDQQQTFEYDGSENIYRIILNDSIPIMPDKWYRAIFSYKNKDLLHYYHGVSSLSEVQPDDEFGVVFKFRDVSILFVHVRSDRIAEIGYKRC